MSLYWLCYRPEGDDWTTIVSEGSEVVVGEVRLVLHERFQKLSPFTFRLTAFASYHTFKWRTFSK